MHFPAEYEQGGKAEPVCHAVQFSSRRRKRKRLAEDGEPHPELLPHEVEAREPHQVLADSQCRLEYWAEAIQAAYLSQHWQAQIVEAR